MEDKIFAEVRKIESHLSNAAPQLTQERLAEFSKKHVEVTTRAPMEDMFADFCKLESVPFQGKMLADVCKIESCMSDAAPQQTKKRLEEFMSQSKNAAAKKRLEEFVNQGKHTAHSGKI